MSRINIRYYKKHPPRRVTRFELLCRTFSKTMDEIGRIVSKHADVMNNTLSEAAQDPFFNPAFLKAIAAASMIESETKKE